MMPSSSPTDDFCRASNYKFFRAWDDAEPVFVQNLYDGTILCIPEASFNYSITADRLCDIGYRVRFGITGAQSHEHYDSVPPLTSFGDGIGGFFYSRMASGGNYTLTTSLHGCNQLSCEIANTRTSISFSIELSCSRRRLMAFWTRNALIDRFFQTNFAGTSGGVSYVNDGKKQRTPTGISNGAYIITQFRNVDDHYMADMVSRFHESEWEDLAGVVSPDIRKRSRISSESNFISKRSRIFGLLLFFVIITLAIGDLLCIACLAGRKESVSHAYMLIFGSVIESLSIPTQSFDENVEWMKPYLNGACVSSIWLFFIGNALVSTVFLFYLVRAESLTKTKRATAVSTNFLASGPGLCYLVAVTLILTVWTVVDPISWVRWEVRKIPLETFALCQSQNTGIYFYSLAAVSCAALLLCFLFAARSNGWNPERKSIVMASCLLLQAWGFGLPMYGLVRTYSADLNYLVRVIFVWGVSITGLVCFATPIAYDLVKKAVFQRPERKVRFQPSEFYTSTQPPELYIETRQQ